MNLSLAEQMIYTTVKVEALEEGQVIGDGTGFFWRSGDSDELMSWSLITNKHVIVDATFIRISMQTADDADRTRPSGAYITITTELHPDQVCAHPEDDVDLVAVNLTGAINMALEEHHIFIPTISRAHVPTISEWQVFDAIEEVYMVGCPEGIHDTVSRRPLVRRGITATAANVDVDGKAEFIVDLACFHGSSGSPVYMYYPDGPKTRRLLDGALASYPQFALLGILYSGPLAEAAVKSSAKKGKTIVVETTMHLGYVIRSTRMLEIDDLIQEKSRAFVAGSKRQEAGV